MGQTGGDDWTSGETIAPRPQTRAAPPTIVIIEQYARLSSRYSHLLDYLGVRLRHVRSLDELGATLHAEEPIAIIWQLAAGLDSGEVLHAISEFDRNLPMLIVADDTDSASGVIDSTIRFLQLADVTKLSGEAVSRDVVEFLFRAGRNSGTFHVLSV